MKIEEQRKSPRFIATNGIEAKILIDGQEWPGRIHNFSASGFAIVFIEEPKVSIDMALTACFAPDAGKPELALPAVIANRGLMPDGQRRIGCALQDLGAQGNAYFAFLTSLITRQGLISSMEKKPVRYRNSTQ